MGISRQSWLPQDTGAKLWDTVKETWLLGFIGFGGPPVHFKIFHDKFVTKLGWIDQQTYQELFSVCQAFSGPGSTKMLYCINLLRNGFLSAVLGFLIWSLPGALGMYGLAVGVSNIGQSLPRPVYALLSGLNAATVGIIALAAVQLAHKAITDRLTRVLVFLGAAAGMLYNALWYFPVLMVAAGLSAVVYDFRWLHGPVKAMAGWVMFWRKSESEERVDGAEEGEGGHGGDENMEMSPSQEERDTKGKERTASQDGEAPAATPINISSQGSSRPSTTPAKPSETTVPTPATTTPPPQTEDTLNLSWKLGLLLILLFFASFAAIMVLRGTLPPALKTLPYALFSNMYLAGTIIFGGGPVVIPLLREYVVAEGWVSPRDFLLGLAIIQAFPGPNFNFAVYLGALTIINGGSAGDGVGVGGGGGGGGGGLSSHAPVAATAAATGAALGFLGIFIPGLWTVHGTMGIWSAVRTWRWVRSALRGVNAAAVGLIYTAVYRLWQIGWIDEGFEAGTSLANDPWWVVVTATSYVGGQWFGVSPPAAIVTGAVLGLVRYGVVVQG